MDRNRVNRERGAALCPLWGERLPTARAVVAGNFSGGPCEFSDRISATTDIGLSIMTTSPTMRILLVSDDVQLRMLLTALLVGHGYEAMSVDGAATLSRRPAADWDAAIIDAAALHGPARWLHALETRAPTIAIAAANDAVPARQLWNRVDAVLHEPLDARKLLLIVRGLLAGRRDAARANRSLTKGPVTLHPLLNAATIAARETLLTDVETRVLRELMLTASTPVSRDRLTRCGLGRGWSPEDRCLDTHIKRLRRKLGPDRLGRTPIRTVRGVGYLLLERWQPAS